MENKINKKWIENQKKPAAELLRQTQAMQIIFLKHELISMVHL